MTTPTRDEEERGRGDDLRSDLNGDLDGDLAVVDRVEIDATLQTGAQLDRLGDPEIDAGEVEVWFEAEALAAASTVELAVASGDEDAQARHSVLEAAPDPSKLLAQLDGPSLSLASLPGWPGCGAQGQGLGREAAALIGELRPGQLLLWSGRERGVGRSSLLAQLADGLALRTPSNGVLTPVLWVSDRSAGVWRARTLARWTGLELEAFVDPGRARALPELGARVEAFEAGPWAGVGERQRFVRAEQVADASAREAVLEQLHEWNEALAAACPSSVQVWPLLLVDPLEALEGESLVARVAELAALARSEDLIILASCDEPRDATSSRALDRHAHARVCVHGEGGQLELELRHCALGRRRRATLEFDACSGRIRARADA